MMFRLLVVLLSIVLLAPATRADCSEGEITATFLVSGIYEGVDVQIDVMDAVPLGPVTNPTEAELIAAVEAALPGYGNWYDDASAGPFHCFWSDPSDFGACAIVDDRDGRVVFAGTVVWSGMGEVRLPLADSHSWSQPGGGAPAPADIGYIDTYYWGDPYGTQEDITAAALDVMRRTDVLQSFGACDAYTATSFIYTPTVGGTDPTVAVCVVMVSGHCGPPWNGEPVAVDAATWSRVRALFE